MKKHIIIFGIIVLFIYSGITSATIIKQIHATSDIRNQGIFNAEIGIRGNEDPIASLEGQYQVRNRFISISGTATNGEAQGRFRGGFRANNFLMQIPIRGQIITIFGKIRLNDENEFIGVWIGRGIPVRGWITGSFIPS